MFKNPTLAHGLCAGALLLGVTAALADDSGTRFRQEMRFLDRDGDGRITEEELTAAQDMATMILMLSWERCDSDDNGTITRKELERAAREAVEAMSEEQGDAEQAAEAEAEESLAEAVPANLLLEQLARDSRYADEVAALREAIEDLDDDDALVSYVFNHPKRYPRLTPVVRTWVRHYPVRPELRRHVTPPPHGRKPGAHRPGQLHPPRKPGKHPAGGLKPTPAKPPAKGSKHPPKPDRPKTGKHQKKQKPPRRAPR